MPAFGATSKANLAECHSDLQKIFNFVINYIDCQIIDGERSIEEQKQNVANGASETMNSLHLKQEDGTSHAVDALPYPYDYDVIERGLNAIKKADCGMEVAEVYYFAGFVAGVAAHMGIPIRQGVDWNGNRDFGDQNFNDLPHTELKK